MKWLFLTLLLINLGLFMLIYPQQQVAERSSLLADVGELKLAGEQESAAANDEPGAVATEELMVEADETTKPELEEPLKDRPAEQQQTQQTALPEEPPAEEIVAETPPPPPQEESPEEVSVRCAMLGYVDTRSAAEEISVRMRALGFKPELQSESRNEQAGYWVLIPQQSTRREAVNIAKKLEESGVSDLWRFTSGKLVHAISLGLFRDEIRAGDRKREIDALGFNSVIQPRYREKTNYWLSYKTGNSAVLSDRDWAGLVKDFPELVRKEIECQ
ncbi:MAG: hypothetical protein JAY99_00965 [Candidatus Thiodiazotropha lotti]|uniref:SPOR domain-containing protein n=1 Tax=Candidatus Thiodiazotropha endoloripes TaxID=1818881 RepID=A0A1E2UP15_9GAMM|nr:hypothetical protein [Candidatus Thiodiazotropha endoloripes]MCG7900186.1 hypothetical protein [Candidatus Thiodiazotropha weberae]MCG7993407.1 hypothetical protein [Candidatus Thiodiazotropha lotti]MCG7901077.1 hypothetical protein [Candidatus Thiodiazotropha weberae]MCG7913324.1 hypothetical protein [Candidatus Thiodiazotropha weberae]MCG7998075.1 hypothetical protein [Candidatus Thiodiazotropha lotti]